MKLPSFRRKPKPDPRDEEIKRLNQLLAQSENERIAFQHTIRQMDQIIYQMSQCENWGQMQPLFRQLHNTTDFRMHQESKRIRNLMVKEIYNTTQALPPVDVPNIGYKKGNQ